MPREFSGTISECRELQEAEARIARRPTKGTHHGRGRHVSIPASYAPFAPGWSYIPERGVTLAVVGSTVDDLVVTGARYAVDALDIALTSDESQPERDRQTTAAERALLRSHIAQAVEAGGAVPVEPRRK